jgi:hypothetical protein
MALYEQSEIMKCPPIPVNVGIGEKRLALAVRRQGSRSRTFFNHAAFCVTRWTNIYFPTTGGVFGDFVGGPLNELFGPGIKDVAVKVPGFWRRATPVAHLCYWWRDKHRQPSDALVKLRDALDLHCMSWKSSR